MSRLNLCSCTDYPAKMVCTARLVPGRSWCLTLVGKVSDGRGPERCEKLDALCLPVGLGRSIGRYAHNLQIRELQAVFKAAFHVITCRLHSRKLRQHLQ
jgi:hypothetical protein